MRLRVGQKSPQHTFITTVRDASLVLVFEPATVPLKADTLGMQAAGASALLYRGDLIIHPPARL